MTLNPKSHGKLELRWRWVAKRLAQATVQQLYSCSNNSDRKSNVRFSDFLFSHYRKKIHCCTDSSKKPSTEQYCETFVFNLNEPAVDGTLVHKLLRLLI